MRWLLMLSACAGCLASLSLPAPVIAQAPGSPCMVLYGFYYSGTFQQPHDWMGEPVILIDPTLSDFSSCDPLPTVPGVRLEHTYSCDVGATLSINGTLVSFHAPASVVLAFTLTGGLAYDAEMVELDVANGTLPAGCMIRESPTQASTGPTTCRDVAWGYLCDSFFDIFTDISLDHGQHWAPSQTPGRVTLRCSDCPVPTRADSWGGLKATYR